MKQLWFHLMPYTRLPEDFAEKHPSVWVDIDSRLFDPAAAHSMYNEFMDELEFAAEMGFDGVCVNEHHQNGYGLMPSPNLIAASLARQTRDAAIVVMGNSLALYNPPVRVAEEMAMIDVLSRGRLECGFVRSVPYEAAPANVMPFRGTDRLWEAHDLIIKAWTTHDGPFNFEGRWYHARQVNIWPRPYQQPHPPCWVTVGSAGTAVPVAQHRYVGAVFLAGYPRIRPIFDGFRDAYRAAHGADTNGRVAIDWGVYGIPETFIVDNSGTIRYKFVGPIDARRPNQEILPVIKKLSQ